MNLSGKVVWLTGASSGIGEALAVELAKKKVKLIISARRLEELNRVGELTRLSDADLQILPLDLADQSDFPHKIEQVLEQFGHVDILINNGGISQRSLAHNTPLDVDRKLFEVNFFGTVGLTKLLLPEFVKRKSGMFVTVTSAVGKFGSPWRTGYSASKHALHGFFDSLRAEVFADNIKVLLVTPGFIATDVSKNALTATGEKLGTMDNATAKGITPKDCALQIIAAIEKEKEEVAVAGLKESFGLLVKRFFPGLFSVMVRKMAVR